MDLAKAAESKSYCDELKGVAAQSRHRDHRARRAPAGPAGRGASGLRPAVRQLRAEGSARQSGQAPGLGGRADEAGGQGQQESRPQELRRVSRARWRGPIYIPGRSVRRASSRPRSTSSRSAGSPSSTCSRTTGRTAASKCIPARTFSTATTFEMFLERVNGHEACNILFDPSHFVLQQLDYLAYIDFYHERIKMYHVKDAEFRPTGKQGVYSGYASWKNRAGRFRSLGDGQVDFNGIFSQVRRLRFRRLGGARMGMRAQASRRRRTRRRAVHQEAHHPRHREGVR